MLNVQYHWFSIENFNISLKCCMKAVDFVPLVYAQSFDFLIKILASLISEIDNVFNGNVFKRKKITMEEDL